MIMLLLYVAKRKDVIFLLKTVFSTLTVAMRYEPANAKFFATEVGWFYEFFFAKVTFFSCIFKCLKWCIVLV